MNYVGKTVFHILHTVCSDQSDTNTKRISRKLPNEYTIKLTIILTLNYMMGIFYEL